MQYEHIFFDLDKTLWDIDANSFETISELFEKHSLLSKGIGSVELFLKEYTRINNRMWEEYRNGTIDKEHLRYNRFHETFSLFNIDDFHLSKAFGDDYVRIAPHKTNLFPHAIEVLNYLHKKYSLHIITNGFEEVQHIKIKNSGLDKYFLNTITSEAAGFQKPDIRIFEFALRTAQSHAQKSIMIGDNMEADILGAKNAGIHQIYFNPSEIKHTEQVTFEIKSLDEVFVIL
ncbi:MAG: YjjG family noncanonical pyrimidine nucleotidase [Bacteroidota bacterium]